METKQKRDSLFICLFLVVATLAVYLQVTRFEFTNFDDPVYVSENPRIQQGFSGETIRWAFTTTHGGNWHPLTWLSHMLDWQFYGANAGGHHLSSVLIHIANTLLLFLSLRVMTGAVWRSGFVAALFALHPMHVESVAWISERKDVLSAFFWILTMLFYARYVKCRISNNHLGRVAVRNYVFALVSLSLGLLAKQMLVTLPFTLLLLDLWPLQRLQTFSATRLLKLCVEKIPFLIVIGVFIPIAIWAQRLGHSVVSIDVIPLDQRLENAFIAYLRYVCKMAWPANLSVFYPYPEMWPAMQFASAVILFLAGFGFAIWQWKRNRPVFFVGWCWFVGTLVPVIGIVQIGSQSMADRYSYIPFIGLFVFVVWGVDECLHRILSKVVLTSGILVTIAACMTVSIVQVGYWSSSVSLFEHALAVSEQNKVARINLGDALLAVGRTNDAMQNFFEALKIRPDDAMAHANIGGIFVAREAWEEAASHYEAALQTSPRNAALHNVIGLALAKQNKLDEAIQHYQTALEIDPDFDKAAYNLGNAYVRQSKWDFAITAYERALAVNPQDAATHHNLGTVFITSGRYIEAEAQLRIAVRLRPDFSEAHHNLAMTYVVLQKSDSSGQKLNQAILHFQEAIRLNTNDVIAHLQLANIATSNQDVTNAILEYRAALNIQPDAMEALNNLAWILATSADAKLRNGDEAVRLAHRACTLVGFSRPLLIGTLAAAYAEAGNSEKAVEMGEAAYQLATSVGQTEIAQKNLELLKLYRAGRRAWESPSAGTNK